VALRQYGAELTAELARWTAGRNKGCVWTQRGFPPYLSSVASSADGAKLVGVVFGGYVYTSGDSGATWTQTVPSTPGHPWRRRLTARSWWLWPTETAPSAATSTRQGTPGDLDADWFQHSWSSVASSWDGTKLVVLDSDGYICTSADSGATWTQTLAKPGWTSVASSPTARSLSPCLPAPAAASRWRLHLHVGGLGSDLDTDRYQAGLDIGGVFGRWRKAWSP